MRLRDRFLATSALLMLCAAPAQAADTGSWTFGSTDPSLLGVGIGLFDETFFDPRVGFFSIDYNRMHFESSDMRFEYASGYNLLPTSEVFGRLHPVGGIEMTGAGGTFLNAGVNYDVNFGPLHFVPAFTPGLFFPGDGKRLNYPLEFRTQVEFAYEFNDRSRLGVAFSHISNSQLSFIAHKPNPGADTVMVYYRFPLEAWFPGSR
jgi:hypothetical protein